jgi:hypothetical protein
MILMLLRRKHYVRDRKTLLHALLAICLGLENCKTSLVILEGGEHSIERPLKITRLALKVHKD